MFVDLGCVMEIESVLLRNTHNADNDNYATKVTVISTKNELSIVQKGYFY